MALDVLVEVNLILYMLCYEWEPDLSQVGAVNVISYDFQTKLIFMLTISSSNKAGYMDLSLLCYGQKGHALEKFNEVIQEIPSVARGSFGRLLPFKKSKGRRTESVSFDRLPLTH